MTQRSSVIVIAIGVGFLAMIATTWLFDTLSWPALNSWGMAHGGFLLVWPAFSYAAGWVIAQAQKEDRE